MMRNKPQSSMQKTYDDCYLICSTAVYFEGQDNEAEALRSWRSALDQIYYHNAYRVPPNYRPKSETEKALQVSLRSMELRCKERVDLLEALKRSRIEGREDGDKIDGSPSYRKPSISSTPNFGTEKEHAGSSAQGTVPIVKYPELSRPGPPLPERPVPVQTKSSPSYIQRSPNLPQIEVTDGRSFPSPALPLPSNQISRTSSPEKRSRMRTTLRTTTEGKKSSKPKEKSEKRPPAASKAAGLAWDSISRSSGKHLGQSLSNQAGSTPNIDSAGRNSRGDISISRRQSEDITRRTSAAEQSQSSEAYEPAQTPSGPRSPHEQLTDRKRHEILRTSSARPSYANESSMLEASSRQEMKEFSTLLDASRLSDQYQKPEADFLSYRNEYLAPSLASQASAAAHFTKPTAYHDPPLPPSPSRQELSSQRKTRVAPPPPIIRRPVANVSSPRVCKHGKHPERPPTSSESTDEHTSSGREAGINARMPRKKKPATINATTPPSSEESVEGSLASHIWEERVAYIKKNLPKGVDENAAKQIFNDIVVKGDEVHWEDVAGLDAAKSALKEAVVYPFLRPDLFMGLREPARGMLLFGPPGTGKTMLARAVATESRSTFFAISASSLTSKWLGESEKLVRALFQLAKALAPSIIFVDEIDSLLSSRGGSSEHESTRRVKTEFLIQWSDLQRAAAGKEQTDKQKKDGDATRVLVLAATNMPWAIDEAARRRFVRRQYIPLPEGHVRAEQLMTLMSHQKHDLSQEDIQVLVELTDGFSGSDITALAKDAAMGPLRSLGEALLHMSMEDIRPIRIADFEASLVNIRPSVSKQGLKEFEDWAKEFGERGG